MESQQDHTGTEGKRALSKFSASSESESKGGQERRSIPREKEEMEMALRKCGTKS